MYVLSSAFKNLRRYADRYILFGVLLCAVLIVGTISFVGADAVDMNLDALLQKYGAQVYMYTSGGPLEGEEYAPFMQFDQVEERVDTRFYFDIYSDAIRVNGAAINFAELPDNAAWIDVTSKRVQGNIGLGYSVTPSIDVLGIDYDTDPSFNRQSGAEHLTQGRLPEQDNEAVLSVSFCRAVLGDFPPLGSTLSLSLGGREAEYTLVGLLGETNFTMDGMHSFLATTREPLILLTLPAAERFLLDGALADYYAYVSQFFFAANADKGLDAGTYGKIFDPELRSGYKTYLRLRDYTLYEDFVSAVGRHSEQNAGRLSTQKTVKYTVRFTEYAAETFIDAYENSVKIMNFFLYAVLLISAAVILIMTALSMHERKYEIGVLLSVGMGKGRVALLFAVESLVFTLLITALAYIVGLLISPMAADRLLEGVATVTRSTAALPVALRMLALAIGLSVPASLVSCLSILRYRPMTILRSRS